MKTDAIPNHSPAPVVQTTTIRRTISNDEPEAPRMPDFWDYIESLKPEDWDNHIVYIYRMDPRASNYGDGQSAIDKCIRYIEVTPGRQIEFNNRDEVQLAIREKHGGKGFRLIIKKGNQRITEGKCSNEAAPKYPNPGDSYQTPIRRVDTEISTTADIAKQAITTMAGQEKQSIDVAVNAVRAAGEMVTKLSQQSTNPHPNSETDDLLKRLMLVMLERAMNPPDPLETLTKLLTIQKQISPETVVSTTNNPVIDRIMSTALDRLLNPPSSTPQTSASAALISQLPQVAAHVVDAFREWRVGTEAQRDTVQLMSKAPAANNPIGKPSPTLLPPIPLKPQNGEKPNVGTYEVSIEFVETKIVEILKEGTTAEEAADETMGFLQRINPILVTRLAELGEAGLLALFQTRPILQQLNNNTPRVVEFIKSFLKYAKEMEEEATPEPPKLPN